MSRKRLLQEMDSKELSYWYALYVLEHQEKKEALAAQKAHADASEATARARESLKGR